MTGENGGTCKLLVNFSIYEEASGSSINCGNVANLRIYTRWFTFTVCKKRAEFVKPSFPLRFLQYDRTNPNKNNRLVFYFRCT